MPSHAIRRVDPIALANTLAVVWGVIAILLLLVFGLVAVIENVFSSGGGFAHMDLSEWLFVGVLPVVYAVFGWIATAIGATTFNLVAGLTGGIRIELEPWTGPTRARTTPGPAAAAGTTATACPACGTAYDPADYRPDVQAPRCSVCGAELTITPATAD